MLKVFGPHGVPTSGLNLASTEANERDLREVFLKPYEVAVKQTGVNSVMTAYNSTNRIPNNSIEMAVDRFITYGMGIQRIYLFRLGGGVYVIWFS